MSKVKIVTFVPLENADELRNALSEAGAGMIGNYIFCSYPIVGHGRFLPNLSANPHIGQPGLPAIVKEERVEVVCEKKSAKTVIEAMKKAHPYEEVAFDIYPLIDEGEL
jgi:hypothetical protein